MALILFYCGTISQNKNKVFKNYDDRGRFYRKIRYLTREFHVKLHAKTDIALNRIIE